MGCLRILLATLTTVLFITLFGFSSGVNAQSAYDDVISVTDKPLLQVSDPDSNIQGIDISNYYVGLATHSEPLPLPIADIIGTPTNPPYIGDKCTFNSNTATAWMLRRDTDSANGSAVTLIYTEDSNPTPLEFTSPYAGLKYTGNAKFCTIVGAGMAIAGQNSVYTTTSSGGNRDVYYDNQFLIFANWDINYPLDYQGSIPPDSLVPPTKTPVWLNYAVKFIKGEKMTIQSDNWTNYRDKHGGGIRYGDVGGTSDITLCRIEDKDNTGCVETLAFVEDRAGPITLEYPKTMVGQVGYYKVFIDNTNKEPKIPPFDEDDYPFDVKNRSIIVFNDGTSTISVDTVGYYEDDSYFPQYDDNVYYNKFMNHNLVDDHGLLNVVLAPIGYLSELPDVTCQPLNLPMPARFGEDINLPCMTESVYQPQFPAIFQIYQLLITAVFSYMVGLRIFQNIKEMSSEKDDSIEVVKL